MKSRILKTSAFILAWTALAPAMAAGPSAQAPRLQLHTYTTPVTPITAEESGALLWMREEEKLARDVYLSFYDVWKSPVFKAIAASEQRHFDAIGSKLVLFGLSDPALPGIGQFANADLQSSYDRSVASGTQSYSQALTVGANIEEVEIRDLQAALDATDNVALKLTYGNLLEGSKNHLRAFVIRLQELGIEYAPQTIDPLLFDAIVGF